MDFTRWLRVAWERALALVLIPVGAAVVIIGWIGVSGEPFPANQLPYIISGGIGGLFMLGLGALCWLSGDLRDEWMKLDRIEEALHDLKETYVVDPEGLASSGGSHHLQVAVTNSAQP